MSMARVFCFFWPRCSWALRCFGSHRKHGSHAANWRNSDQGLSAMESIRFTASSLPLLAPNGHGRMSDLSPLSGEQRKSNFGAARSVDDPEETSPGRGTSRGEIRDPCYPTPIDFIE